MNILIKNVISNMKNIPEFTDDELDVMSNYFEYKKVRRKSVVLRKDEPSTEVYYVVSGCLRLFCLDQDEKEYTINFAPSDYWLADFKGYLDQSSTCMMIDSIVDTEYLTLSYENREKMFKQFPTMERYFRLLVEHNAAFAQNKALNDKKHDARERYEDFCRIYPNLVGRVKDKHVASYIGVTPEFFSKMINSKQI